jgi:hypothetical protein
MIRPLRTVNSSQALPDPREKLPWVFFLSRRFALAAVVRHYLIARAHVPAESGERSTLPRRQGRAHSREGPFITKERCMFRACLASVFVASSLVLSGCSSFDHPWFSSRRDQCCPQATCTPCCNTAGAAPIMDGPMLPSQDGMPMLTGQMPVQTGQMPVLTGQVPVGSQPRLVPAPQSVPMPYAPGG